MRFAAARAGPIGTSRTVADFVSVAATSLSDIVCGFHVAGCCIETTSDPTMHLAWRRLEVDAELRVLR